LKYGILKKYGRSARRFLKSIF